MEDLLFKILYQVFKMLNLYESVVMSMFCFLTIQRQDIYIYILYIHMCVCAYLSMTVLIMETYVVSNKYPCESISIHHIKHIALEFLTNLIVFYIHYQHERSVLKIMNNNFNIYEYKMEKNIIQLKSNLRQTCRFVQLDIIKT